MRSAFRPGMLTKGSGYVNIAVPGDANCSRVAR
jgi:hypothetical protein